LKTKGWFSVFLQIDWRKIFSMMQLRKTKYNLNKAPSARKYTNMQKTIEAINNCGVSFSVWEKRNADGTPSGLYDWTSMVGNEKKKVLRSLPEKFPQILDPEHCNTITKIWKVFCFVFYS